MTINNELSELQAIDFALGGFIADAFVGLSATTGPREWREFLGRTKSAQIFRHDAASPGDFVKSLQASRKAETGASSTKANNIPLPAVYYYRKPGFTNVNDRSKRLRRRFALNEDMSNAYNIKALQLDLDYTIVFVAWDKPTLDKLCMAWYAYVCGCDTAIATYRIGEDTFDVPVTILDHCNLTISDSSEPAENGRLFAATTSYAIHTQILFGAQVPMPPDTIRIKYMMGVAEAPLAVNLGIGDGINSLFSWDAIADIDRCVSGALNLDILLDGVRIARWNGARLVATGDIYTVTCEMVLCQPLSLYCVPSLLLDSVVLLDLTTGDMEADGLAVAHWDGAEWEVLDGTHAVTGNIFPDFSSIISTIIPPPPDGAVISLSLDMGGDGILGSGCPSCHQYPKGI